VHFVGLFLSSLLKMHGPKKQNSGLSRWATPADGQFIT